MQSRFTLPGRRNVSRGLNTEHHLHADTEGKLDAQGHLRRQRRLLIQKIGQGGSPHAKDFRSLDTVRLSGARISSRTIAPGWLGIIPVETGASVIRDNPPGQNRKSRCP